MSVAVKAQRGLLELKVFFGMAYANDVLKVSRTVFALSPRSNFALK
jgi:hypothetical protein